MLWGKTFQALRTAKPLSASPQLARAYATDTPSSMGTSRPGWFRTEQDKTRALWAAAILATVGGWWYMTREPNARKEYEKVKQGMRGTSSSNSSTK
ncbi:hypothetical protein Rt10032_c10g4296 [Rhodotorula toruloides]|uniref:Uncharacterized protein n=1 Tax=Rhodotorula toruloides TaxID=5286 RepID=A0A511KIS6_RHOTO|nr:hypothetical protein Rt10032_c10g4296 [Rhodotorula toruloides]